MLSSNEGCKYTRELPQQAGDLDGPSVYGALLVGLSALWDETVDTRSPSLPAPHPCYTWLSGSGRVLAIALLGAPQGQDQSCLESPGSQGRGLWSKT